MKLSELKPITHDEVMRRTDGRGVCIVLRLKFNGYKWEAWPEYEGRRNFVAIEHNPWKAIGKLGEYVIRHRLIKNRGLYKAARRSWKFRVNHNDGQE